MNHPYTRAERRYVRDCIIAKRRFIYLYIWGLNKDYEGIKAAVNPLIDINYVLENYPNVREYPEWGRYAKWNFVCDINHCRLCSWERIEKIKNNKKRRISQKNMGKDEETGDL